MYTQNASKGMQAVNTTQSIHNVAIMTVARTSLPATLIQWYENRLRYSNSMEILEKPKESV